MPNYNYSQYLNYAIQSVVNQTFNDWELIIIDDGSTDSSKNIILEYAKLDDRIKFIFNNKNKGIAYSCNEGIRASKGDYILMMASDDMLKDNLLKIGVKVLDTYKNCSAIIIEGEVIDEENNRLNILFSDLHRKPKITYGRFFKELLKGNFVCTGMFKREYVHRYGIYYNANFTYLNDWLFWLQLAYVGNFFYIEEPLYLYRIHTNSTSFTHMKEHIKEAEHVFDFIVRNYCLSRDEKSIIYIKKGVSNLKQKRFNRARELFIKSFTLNPNVTSMALILVSFPITYTFFDIAYKIKQNLSLSKAVFLKK